ncbi:MAG: hypothetical protein PVJ63_01795 [Thioalkalispiraceae bacterium]
MKSRYLTLSLIVISLLAPLSASQAAVKCWKNKEGVRECGQAVPPEYSQQRIEILNSKGVVVKVIERAKTPEELEEFRRQEKLRKAREREKAAQKRRDLILLQTYTTEKDLLLARKQNLRAVEGIISITNSNTSTLKENLKVLEKRAADFERAGEQPPEDLLKDMENLKSQIRDNEEFISKKVQALQETEKKFDADLKRFRELKGIQPPSDEPGQSVKN